MNTLEQLKTAIGEPLKRKLGDTEFEFYPLDITSMPDFFELSARISGKDETAILKRENAEMLVNLILRLLRQAFPNKEKVTDEEYEKILGQFAMKHFVELQGILTELHSPDVEKLSPAQKSKIEQLKAKALQKNADSGTAQATG